MSYFSEIHKMSDEFRDNLQREMSKALTGSTPDDIDEPAGFFGSGMFFGQIPPKKKAEEYLESATGWVYACVNAIAEAVSKVELRLYKIKGDDDVEEVKNHALLDVLYRVNNYTTWYDHICLSQQYLELSGESPWFIDRGESGTQEPQNIMLLRPDKLQIVQETKSTTGSPIKGYKYKLSYGNEIDIKVEELLFLKYPDPTNTFRGKGTLQAAAMTVDIDNFSEDFNRRFFYNSARPDSILTTDQKLTPIQRQSLRQDIKRLYQGRENSHKTAILESGLDWKPMSVSQKDMDFLAQQKFSRDKILALFRVHKSILGITEEVNLANAEVGEVVFAKWTVQPKIMRIVAQLNEFYLPMFKGTEGMFLSFDDPVPQNVERNLARYDSALGKGWMTINEIRGEQNLDDIGEDGNKIYIPNSMTPIELAGKLAPAAFGMRRDIHGTIVRSAGGYTRAMRRLRAINEKKKSIDKIEGKIQSLAKEIVAHSIRKRKEDEKKKMYIAAEGIVKRSDKFLPRYQKEVADNFGRQKGIVLSRFPKKDITVDDYLLDEEEEVKVLFKITTPIGKEIIKTQGTAVAALVGEKPFDEATKRVQDFLRKNGIKFAKEVSRKTNEKIRETLAAGVSEGEGIPKLKKRITTLFDDMSSTRAELIARSEVIRASNFATEEAFKQSGVVEKKEWLVTADDRLCEFCAPMSGKIISIGGSFFGKGDTIDGEEGGSLDNDYGSIDYPPLHPQCRCTIIPIIS